MRLPRILFENRTKQCIIAVLLLLVPLMYLAVLADYHLKYYARSGAFGPNPSIGTGLGLIFIGLFIPVLGMIYRVRPRLQDRIQDLVFAILYLLIGTVTFFIGWRLDPVLQVIHVLLIELSIYLLAKDIFTTR